MQFLITVCKGLQVFQLAFLFWRSDLFSCKFLIHKDTLFSFAQNLFIWKSVSDNDLLLNEKKANKKIEKFNTNFICSLLSIF